MGIFDSILNAGKTISGYNAVAAPFAVASAAKDAATGENKAQFGFDQSPFAANKTIQGQYASLNGTAPPSAMDANYTYQHNETPYSEEAYKAKDYSGALPEYDTLRQQAKQTSSRNTSTQQDALARRYAGMGMLSSGSYIKNATNLESDANQNEAQTEAGIGFQEAQQRRGLQQGEENKVFQSSEAGKGRSFTAGQAAAQRAFQGGQTAQQLNYQTKMFNAQQGNQFNQWKFDAGTKLDALTMQDQTLQEQQRSDAYNAAMNQWQSQHSGGLLGAGGLMGTGIGA